MSVAGRRCERIANLIREIVGEAIIARLSDPRIEPLTSVTRVEVTPDLALARINVSVMAAPAQQQLTVKALRSAAGRLRRLVRENISARQIPQLEFFLDDSIQRSFETISALDALGLDEGVPDGAASAPGPDSAQGATDLPVADAPTDDVPPAGAADAGMVAPQEDRLTPEHDAQPRREEGDA